MTTAIKLDYKNGFRLPLPKKKKEYKEHSQIVYALIYYRKEILIISTILFLMLSGLFIASCREYEDYVRNGTVDVPGLLGLLLDTGGWIDTMVGVDKLNEYEELLKIGITNGNITSIGGVTGSLTSVGKIVQDINGLFQVIGFGLLLIFWGYGFSEMMLESNGQIILEQVIKKLVFLIVGYTVIANSLVICSEIVNLGTVLTETAVGSINYSAIQGDTINALKKTIFDDCTTIVSIHGLLDLTDVFTSIMAIGWLIQLLLPWIISLLCDLIIRVLCWSRAIEICIFIAISPIMFIDLGTTRDLTHSSTARALKNLLSLSMQGALIMLSLAVCSAIMEGIGASGGLGVDTFLKMSLVALLRVGTISKTQSVAKQALGL